MAVQFISASEAAGLLEDGQTLWIEGGSGGLNEPGALYAAVRRRFESEGHPKNLTLLHPNGVGDGKGRGVDLFAVEGLVSRCVGGHYGFSPEMVRLINEERIEGYNIPQGIMAQLIREIASRRPGLLTHVGLHTFVDPRLSGGALNSRSREKLVEVMTVHGREYLFYPAPSIDVVFIRGSEADEDGNITMDDEAAYLNMLPAAQAGHNHGIVVAQVKRKVKRGSMDPRRVKVPGILVDYVVVAEEQWQTFAGEYNAALCGAAKLVMELEEHTALDVRKVVARRAAMELRPGIVNLGFGMSSLVADVAHEEGLSDSIVLTIEQGAVGGVPASGLIFGCSHNPQAILDQPYQFDFYDGGGIDTTFLGLAQVDASANVNVSKFGSKIAGAGGFINITQGAKKIVYCGTFTAGGLEVEVGDAGIRIVTEGKIRKFVKSVEHVTFSSRFAMEAGKEVVYVTERAVFRLIDGKLVLVEIAPGVDLETEILAQMDFAPEISSELRPMDLRVFLPRVMGIREEVLTGVQEAVAP